MSFFTLLPKNIKPNFLGVGLCVIFAITALSFHHSYGIPVMLMGLLLGMAMSSLYQESEKTQSGVDFAASKLLRLGIVLIGFRFTTEQVSLLTPIHVATLSVFAAATLGFGLVLSRLMGLSKRLGVLSGSAVGICGASAALAVSAVLDPKGDNKHLTLLTVATVTSLSTIAMLLYPLIGRVLNLDDMQMSYLLGASIHDVAQVVGAGYSVSAEVGDKAVLVKLIRILNLLPIVLVVAYFMSKRSHIEKVSRTQLVPTFLIVFMLVATFNLMVPLPQFFVNSVQQLSSYLILISIIAIGLKTDLKQLFSVGYLPLLLIAMETVFLLAIVLMAIFLASFMGI